MPEERRKNPYIYASKYLEYLAWVKHKGLKLCWSSAGAKFVSYQFCTKTSNVLIINTKISYAKIFEFFDTKEGQDFLANRNAIKAEVDKAFYAELEKAKAEKEQQNAIN